MDNKNQQNQGQRQPYGQRQGYQGGGNRGPRPDRPVSDMFERVVQVNRVSKKGKGGDKRSVSVLVVVGDKKGKVGVGHGKAADVQTAAAKATTYAKRHLVSIDLKEGRTIAHDVYVKLGAARLIVKPAPAGTGIIAGGAVRVIAEAAGIQDVVAKILGTPNKASNVQATLEALRIIKERSLRQFDKIAKKADKVDTTDEAKVEAAKHAKKAKAKKETK